MNCCLCLILFLLAAKLPSASAQPASQPHSNTLDQILFGNVESETSHHARFDFSDVVAGALGESARRLLAKEPASYEGGRMTFTVAVDPQEQNYLTVKFWGSDKGEEHGYLMLFADNLQIGYRTEGDYDVLNRCDAEGEAPGRWVYQTAILPIKLTKGKTSLELTIRSFGPVWWYGPNFEKFQKNLESPSRGIYRAYTHTNTRFNPPTDEIQGKLESKGIRPGPGEEVIEQSKQVVISRISHMLEKIQSDPAVADNKKREGRLLLLSEAYNVAWTPAHKNPKVIDQLIEDGDDSVRAYLKEPKSIEGTWLGFGPMGCALVRTWPAIKTRLDEKIDLGVAGANTRGQAWAVMLRASVDYWRTHRRGYTNQSAIVDYNIYTANRGLRLIDPERALPEEQVVRYLHEAIGIEPWRGSDEYDAAIAQTQSIAQDRNEAGWRFGDTYKTVTRKGLSREVGWVGTYGETIFTFMREMYDMTGDEKIRQQMRKIEASRVYFRYPGVDAEGYQCMKLASEIDNRTAHYPLSGGAYTAPNIGESWWMEVPALLSDDPVAVGAAQQSLADNQYFPYIESRLKHQNTIGMMRNVDEYAKVKALPPSAFRLPATPGQPDYVFSDEQNAVLAIKHGETHLFFNFYYRSFYGINGVVRILEVNPSNTRLVSVKSQYSLENQVGTYVRPNYIHSQYSLARSHLPPGSLPDLAMAGEELPIAAPPAGIKPLKDPVWGPFAGKADFYQLRYGEYLIAVNTTDQKSYDLTVPSDATSARDLASNIPVEPRQKISVKPLTSLVIYLGTGQRP